MGRIYARKIHNGEMMLEEVPDRFVEATLKAYTEMYGELV